MFIRVKNAGKYRYLQLVENRLEGSRKVQRVLCTLGRLEELEATGSIDVLLRSLGRFSRRPSSDERRDLAIGTERAGSTLQPDQDRTTDAFRKSPTFSDLDGQQIVELAKLGVARKLKPGDFLFFEGEPVKSSHLIVSGILKLVKHSVSGVDFITGIYGQGEVVGNTLQFAGQVHPSSAQAAIDTEVLSISTGNLISFLQQYPALKPKVLGKMLAVIGQRYQAAIVRLRELAGERVEHRLARVLLALYLGLGSSIPLTRREIAEMSGTTTETAARFMSRLTRSGIVQSLRGKVIVIDRDRLRQLAERS